MGRFQGRFIRPFLKKSQKKVEKVYITVYNKKCIFRHFERFEDFTFVIKILYFLIQKYKKCESVNTLNYIYQKSSNIAIYKY